MDTITEQLATDLTVKRLLIATTGDRESVRLEMAKRMRAEALRHAGDCLNAIYRHVPTDMLAAWRRFTECMGQRLEAHLGPAPKVDSIWLLPSLVVLVMANVDSGDANRHWLWCERSMRAFAEHRAIELRRHLDTDPRMANLDADDDERLAMEGEITALLRFAYPVQAVSHG